MIAVITGAAAGLGAELARQLQPHYQLVLIDRDPLDLAQLGLNPERIVMSLQCDLSDPDQITGMLRQLEQLERLDLLINNAGITHRSRAEVTDLTVIQRVMQVDYFAPVQLTQRVLPLLRDSQGLIVNMSSMAGWMPVLGRAGYCAAKAALHQYFETLRSEVAAQGIAVLMVYPSFVATQIEQNALGADGGRAQHARSVVGKVSQAEDLVEAIVRAIGKRQQRLFPDRFTYFSSLLYRVAPKFYHRLMRKRFAEELTS